MASSDIARELIGAQPKARQSPFRILGQPPIVTLLPIAGVLILWEAASDLNLIERIFFPAPHTIFAATWRLTLQDDLLQQLSVTLQRIILGFILGSVPGITLGLLMGRIRMVRTLVDPLISLTYPIPHLAVLPLLLVIFGLGSPPIIVLAAIICFYPAVINTLAGVSQADKRLIRMARNLGASDAQVVWKIVLPGALPSIFAGVRLALGGALLATVAGEFVAASTGIGAQTWLYWQIYQIDNMYGTLVVIVALGLILTYGMQFVQRRFFGWATAAQGE